MSTFIPNSTQIPNILFDQIMSELSGSEFKCLCLVIRKTRGWHKEVDAIPVNQFKKFTGIKRDRTIQDTLKNLVKLGWIVTEKTNGKTSKYKLSDRFNQCRKTAPAENGTGDENRQEPVPFSDIKPAKTSAGKPPYTKDNNKQNTNIQNTKGILVEIPDDINPEAWSEFEEYRKKIKKPLTSLGRTKLFKKLNGLSFEIQQEVIDETITNSWTGLFTKNFTKVSNHESNSRSNRHKSNHEQVLDGIYAGCREP